MNIYGLIGHPLGHSFSKTYFNEKFEKENLDCQYLNFDLEDLSDLPELWKKFPELCGFNVTAPYKEKIIPYLDEYDDVIDEIKAVNTVKIIKHHKLKGFNTDIFGFITIIYNINQYINLDQTKALILGTGGASKAIQWVLRRQRIPYEVVSRAATRGDLTYGQMTPELVRDHLVIINATPLGLYPNVDQAPSLPFEALTSRHCLIDLNYNPEETLFLRHGREQGAFTVNGLPMLHAQAEASWEIWNSPTSTPASLLSGER